VDGVEFAVGSTTTSSSNGRRRPTHCHQRLRGCGSTDAIERSTVRQRRRSAVAVKHRFGKCHIDLYIHVHFAVFVSYTRVRLITSCRRIVNARLCSCVICVNRWGIEHRGLLKSQLIEALCADYASVPADGDDNGEMMPIEDEIVSGSSESPEMHDIFSEVGESPTHHAMSEAVRLKLIELEIEKTKLEQCKLQPSTPPERVGFRPRKAHVPVMAESGDPLAFFASFEKKHCN